MSEFSVDRVDMPPDVLEHIRNALALDDPYRAVIEDHRALFRAHHHPLTFIAKDEEPLAYALIHQPTHIPEAVLDIVVVPDHEEDRIVATLLDRVLSETSLRISWWTRAPRFLNANAHAAEFGGTPHRTVLRFVRPLDEPVENTLVTRPFDGDAIEIARINNEAFATHPDRAHLTENDVHEQLRVFGNRYEDLRLTDGGFCWSKRRSASESELFVLAVDNAHRGQGLGKQLLLSTLEYVRVEHRVNTASLYVEHDNKQAIALYKANGFVDIGQSLHSVVFPERHH